MSNHKSNRYKLTPIERARKLARHTNFKRRRVVLAFRKMQWRSRRLPDFLVIGAQKAGSTSMYHYLGDHPQILQSYEKEVQYFCGGLKPQSDRYARGEAWYRSQFPKQSNVAPGQQVFEASPRYLHHPLAPERIANDLPNVKMIVVLRNPVQRAISHYFHTYGQGREPLALWDALQAEKERLAPLIANKDYRNPTYDRQSYIYRGQYAEQLARFFDRFPREQLLVIQGERLYADTQATLVQTFQFLGVDPTFRVPNLKPRNVSRKRTDVEPRVYEFLKAHYEPHNERLYELLGERYDW